MVSLGRRKSLRSRLLRRISKTECAEETREREQKRSYISEPCNHTAVLSVSVSMSHSLSSVTPLFVLVSVRRV